MTRVTPEVMLEWAQNPPDWKTDALVSSDAESAELREWLIGHRLYLLYNMAAEELVRRDPESLSSGHEILRNGELDFSSIPLKLTLNKRQCYELSGKVWSNFTKDWYWSQPVAIRAWNEEAEIGAIIGGYGMLMSKYTDIPYSDYISPDGTEMRTAEEMFSEALSRSDELTEFGLHSPLLMDGVQKIDFASLDLEVVEGNLNKGAHPNLAHKWFWRSMIDVKRRNDQEMNRTTYADVVREMIDGVYIAPYLDPSVRDSGLYITRDNVVAACVDLGLDVSRANNAFTLLLSSIDPEGRIPQRFYTQGWRDSALLGATFFHKRLLVDMEDRLKFGNAKQLDVILGKLLERYIDNDNDGHYEGIVCDDETYNGLVYGA